MKIKQKISVEQQNYLEELDPEWISIVADGANLTPIAMIKSQGGFFITKFEFKTEEYDKKSADSYMKGFFEKGTYTIETGDSIITAKSEEEAPLGLERFIDIDDNVRVYLVDTNLQANTDVSKKDDIVDTIKESSIEENLDKMSSIDKVLEAVRLKFQEEVEADAAPEDNSEDKDLEKSEETAETEAKAEATEETEDNKEETEKSEEEASSEDAEAKEDSEEEKTEKSEETEEESEEINQLKQKFDYFAAMFSESSDLKGVIAEGHSDGIPVGFDELTTSFTTALSNAIKKGETSKVSQLAIDFGTMLQGIVDLTKSEEPVEKSEEEASEKPAEENESTENVEKSEETAEEDNQDPIMAKLEEISKSLEQKATLEEVKSLIKEEQDGFSGKVSKLEEQFQSLRHGKSSPKSASKQKEVQAKEEVKTIKSLEDYGSGEFLSEIMTNVYGGNK